MVIYVPTKFEFDWTNRFRVRVRKQKCGRTDRQTDKRTKHGQMNGLNYTNFKNSIRDARTPQPGQIVFNTMGYRSSETVQSSRYFQSSVSYIKVQIMLK